MTGNDGVKRVDGNDGWKKRVAGMDRTPKRLGKAMNTQINQTHKHGIGSLAPEGWYTVSQVADLIGRSPETIKRWQRAGFYQATNQMSVGKLKVWVYSDDDVAAMREAIKTIKHGRPPKVRDDDDNS